MSQPYALHLAELKTLIDQLSLSHNSLERLIGRLSDLPSEADLPERHPAPPESCPAGQERPLWRSPNASGSGALSWTTLIAEDPRMRIAVGLARSMAEMDAAVLIQGATGTGKNLLARLIHHQGTRAQRPLVTFPCRQFNHVDTMACTRAFFAEADNGTLILEDIDELPPAAQRHLFTILQHPVTCRLISLTCHDPDDLVRHQGFSVALLERLRECHIALPNLASRSTDIEHLARYYAQRFCAAAGMTHKQLSPEYLNLLTLYAWPGNVRELINTLEQSLLSAGEQKTLYVKDLPAHLRIQTLPLSAARKKGL